MTITVIHIVCLDLSQLRVTQAIQLFTFVHISRGKTSWPLKISIELLRAELWFLLEDTH